VERDSSLGVGLGLVLIARQRARNGGQGRRYWTGKLIRLQCAPLGRGKCHGDMHPGNIMMSQVPSPTPPPRSS